jgi:cation:H+ antiporter
MSAGLGMFMISFVGFCMLIGPLEGANIAHIGIYSILIPIFYLLAIRTSYAFESENNVASELVGSKISIKKAVIYFTLSALTIVLAGAALPFVGERIVHVMDWNSAFVGTAFIALATSLPELAVTISAVKIGAVEMALSNVLGSNIFNIIILAIDDVLYTKGPLLASVAKSHTVTALAALMMTSLIVIGLIMPPKKKYFNRVSMLSIFLVMIFILNMYISYGDSVAVPK